MKWCIYPTSLTLSCVLFSWVCAPAGRSQVIPDDTLPTPTQVTIDNLDPSLEKFNINGGTQAGGNLFHSFSEFSVPEMGEAFFNNAADVQNIFSRVTGGSVSDIQGVIRANGTANLFLLNPAGIVFGPNARLEIGGSFFGSTADSVVFSDNVVFSATDTNPQPLLTINVPVGLQFGSTPGDIQVRGGGIPNIDDISPLPNPDNPTADDLSLQQRTFLSSIGGLRVSPGKTLGLVGGNLTFSGGLIQAPEGRLELGSVGAGSRVNIRTSETGFALNYEGVQNFQDIGLTERAGVFASGERGGDIQIQGQNLTLTDGSEIRALTLGSGSGGSLLVNTSEAILLSGQFTDLDGNTQNNILGTGTYGSGKAGEVNLITGSLQLQDESLIYIFTLNAETENVTVNADRVQLNGDSFLGLLTIGTGRAGDLTVNTTESIEVNSDSALAAVTLGEGEAGNVYLNTQRFTAQDEGNVTTLTVERDNLGVNTRNRVNRPKKVGNIEIQASDSIDILRGGSLLAGTTGESIGGNITLTTPTLRVQDGASVEASTLGTGNAGNITVKPPEGIEPESIELSGGGELTAQTTGDGAAGSVTLTTGELIVRDRGRIETLTTGDTDRTDENGRISNYAGDITVTAFDSVELTSEPERLIGPPLDEDAHSGLYAGTEGTGDAGKITINTPRLVVQDRGRVVASTESLGNAGNINVNVNPPEGMELESIELTGNGDLVADTTGSGSAGNVTLHTGEFIAEDGGSVATLTRGFTTQMNPDGTFTNSAGNIEVTASESVELRDRGSLLLAGTVGSGDAGNVTIRTPRLSIRDEAGIFAASQKLGEEDTIGKPGYILIQSDKLRLSDEGQIIASSETGEGGRIGLISRDIEIERDSAVFAYGATSDVDNEGEIAIVSDRLILSRDESKVITVAQNPLSGRNLFLLPQDPDVLATGLLVCNSCIIGASGTFFRFFHLPKLTVAVPIPVDVNSLIREDVCEVGVGSEFIIPGSGGIPPSPLEPFSGNGVTEIDWIEFVPENIATVPQPENAASEAEFQEPEYKPLVEAQGWIVGENGQIFLVADSPTVTPAVPALNRIDCTR